MARDIGGGFLSTAVLVWVSVSVGPWWVGIILLLGGLCLNLAAALAKKKGSA